MAVCPMRLANAMVAPERPVDCIVWARLPDAVCQLDAKHCRIILRGAGCCGVLKQLSCLSLHAALAVRAHVLQLQGPQKVLGDAG